MVNHTDFFPFRVKQQLALVNNFKSADCSKVDLNAMKEIITAHHVGITANVSSQCSSKVLLNAYLSINSNLFQPIATLHLNNSSKLFYFSPSSMHTLHNFSPEYISTIKWEKLYPCS